MLFPNRLHSTCSRCNTFPCKILKRLSCGLCFSKEIHQGAWREKEWMTVSRYIILRYKMSCFCLVWPAVITALDTLVVIARNSPLKSLKSVLPKLSFQYLTPVTAIYRAERDNLDHWVWSWETASYSPCYKTARPFSTAGRFQSSSLPG